MFSQAREHLSVSALICIFRIPRMNCLMEMNSCGLSMYTYTHISSVSCVTLHSVYLCRHIQLYTCIHITHTYSWIVIRSIEDQLIRLCVCGHGDNDSWRHMSHIAYMSHGGCVAGSQGPSSWDNGNSLIAAK